MLYNNEYISKIYILSSMVSSKSSITLNSTFITINLQYRIYYNLAIMDDNEEYDNEEDQDQNEEAAESPEKHSEGQKEYLEVNGQLKGKEEGQERESRRR